MRWSRPARPAAAASLLALLVLTGCGTKYARVPVYEDGLTRVVLRAVVEDGARIDRGFSHPATISGIRIAHVLAQIDVRKDIDDESGGQRVPAIHTDLIYPMGEWISAGLAKADPSQAVVVMAVRKEKRLGIFTHRRLTNLIAFVDAQDRLQLHLHKLDWQVPKGKEDEQREPVLGRESQSFRVIAAESMERVGHQGVAVYWRDKRFRKASTIRIGRGGKIERRTVLMESEAPAEEEASDELEEEVVLDSALSDPATLRALADLEDRRRQGAISEAAYFRERRKILAGAEGP